MAAVVTFPKPKDEIEAAVYKQAAKGKAALVKAALLCAETAGAPEEWRKAAERWIKSQAAADALRCRDLVDEEQRRCLTGAAERLPITHGTKAGRALLLAVAAQDDVVSGRGAVQIAAAYAIEAARATVRTVYDQHCREKAQHVTWGGPERAQAVVAAKLEASS